MESTVTTWKGDDFEIALSTLAVRSDDVVLINYPGRLSCGACGIIQASVKTSMAKAGLPDVPVFVCVEGLSIVTPTDGEMARHGWVRKGAE